MRLIDADHFLKTLEQTVMDDKADPAWRKIANAMQFMVTTEVFFFQVTKTGKWEGPENGYYHCTKEQCELTDECIEKIADAVARKMRGEEG